jgi:hypothetical protein
MVSVIKWLTLGLAGAFVLSALIDPQRAFATTQAFSGVGSALGSVGTGIQSLFTGIGTGTAKLLNPLWTLRDLIYGPQAGVQVEKDIYQSTATGNLTTQQTVYETQSIQLDPNAPYTPVTTGFGGVPLIFSNPSNSFTYTSQPSISPVPVTQAVVHGQTLPLSAAAVEYYNSIGVTVTPASSQTVSSQNSGNATGVSSASANYSAGAAQAAGYSTGAPS